MMYNTTNPSIYSSATISTNGTYSSNYKDLTIKKNKVVTLNGSIFHNIKIEDGAQVTFTSATVNVNQLLVGVNGGNAGSQPTRVMFTGSTKVLVKDKVTVDESCQINSTSQYVVFYVDGGNFEIDTKNTNVTAGIYIPTGDLVLSTNNGPCVMTGRFIAKYIDGHSGYVTWNGFNCASPPPAPPVTPVDIETKLITKIEALAYPNPSANWFNVKLNTDATDEVTVRVMSVTGQVMQELKGSPDQTFRVGDRLLPGFYIAEVRQGKEMVTVKLVKQ